MIQVTPERGLEVKISGSGASGSPPTTLSPTILHVNWRCMAVLKFIYHLFLVFYNGRKLRILFTLLLGETARDEPYGVDFLIPVEGYDPIEFTLTKICG